MKRFINPNILNEGNQMEVIQDDENELLPDVWQKIGKGVNKI